MGRNQTDAPILQQHVVERFPPPKKVRDTSAGREGLSKLSNVRNGMYELLHCFKKKVHCPLVGLPSFGFDHKYLFRPIELQNCLVTVQAGPSAAT